MPLQRSMLLAAALVMPIIACAPKTEATSDTTHAMAMNTAAVDPAAAKQAIEAANAKFVTAMTSGDTATAANNYADDAIIMMANEEPWRGRAAITNGFAGLLSQMTPKAMSFHTDDVMLAGDLAVETGTYDMTLQPKTGKAVTDKGKYLTVWKHQPDGSWKIIRDINNTSLPAAGAK
jgi:uncharacterized protein (TIGR02246 family)